MHANPMPGPTTQLLNAICQGKAAVEDELLPLVYRELRQIARAHMAREQPGHTLQPTALVHEAYLRLLGDADVQWNDRRHFYGAAAQAMRRILIDRARRAAREKHGGHLQRQSFSANLAQGTPPSGEILALDSALDALEDQDGALAEIVKMRFFAGLTIAETARALGVSARTVNRQWLAARAWLAARMLPDGPGNGERSSGP